MCYFYWKQMQSESENENGGISVVVVDKEQSHIDYGSVKKTETSW